MPVVPPVRQGTVVGAYPVRGDIRDALVHPGGLPLDRLLPGTTIGTTSVRRAAYLARSHSHLKVMPVLGIVEQRLKALEASRSTPWSSLPTPLECPVCKPFEGKVPALDGPDGGRTVEDGETVR